jgi:hypothetical protein
VTALVLAERDEHGNRLGVESPGGEQERARGGVVEPVGIVHQHEQRLAVRGGAQEAQGGRAQGQRVGGGRRSQRQGGGERLGLPLGQLAEEAGEGPQQCGEPAERDVGLGFDPSGRDDLQAVRPLAGVAEQGALAYSGLAP